MIAPIPMVLHDNPEAPDAPVGAFAWQDCRGDTRWVTIKLPRDLSCTIQVVKGEAQPGEGIRWGWDGNETQPTLRPSIRTRQLREWHGWVTAGQLETHEDSQDG